MGKRFHVEKLGGDFETEAPSGICSAHRTGEDPTCRVCYPEGPPEAAPREWVCGDCGEHFASTEAACWHFEAVADKFENAMYAAQQDAQTYYIQKEAAEAALAAMTQELDTARLDYTAEFHANVQAQSEATVWRIATERMQATAATERQTSEALRAELKAARDLLAPACSDETLVGAIRNLQQAHISERDNATAAEATSEALKARASFEIGAMNEVLIAAESQLSHAHETIARLREGLGRRLRNGVSAAVSLPNHSRAQWRWAGY